MLALMLTLALALALTLMSILNLFFFPGTWEAV